MEELHTKVQVTITTPHISTAMIFGMSRCWSLYHNMCVVDPSSENMVTPGEMLPFYLETIILKMEGGRYVGPLFTVAL